VSIDGVAVGKFSAKQLADGVNLGTLTVGPVWEQGNKVLQAINEKNQIVHQRFRGVVMFNAPDWLKDVADERKPQELAKPHRIASQSIARRQGRTLVQREQIRFFGICSRYVANPDCRVAVGK